MLRMARGLCVLATWRWSATGYTRYSEQLWASPSRPQDLNVNDRNCLVSCFLKQEFLASVVSTSPTHVSMSVFSKYTHRRGSERIAKNSSSVGVLLFSSHSWELLVLLLYCSLCVSGPLRRKIPALVLVLSLGACKLKEVVDDWCQTSSSTW